MSKRSPYSLISKHELASNNLDKVIQETNAKTKRDYHKRFLGMYQTRLQQACTQLNIASEHITPHQVLSLLADDIEQKRSSGKLKHSSLRQYKAAVNYGLTYIAAAKDAQSVGRIPPTQFAFYHSLSDRMTLEQVDELSARVLTWGVEVYKNTQKLDKIANARNQTSTSKMKGFPKPVYDLIMADTYPGRHWLREFIFFNIKFGLRPKEWQHTHALTARAFALEHPDIMASKVTPQALQLGLTYLKADVSDDVGDLGYQALPYVLVVKNGKHSHGRACGEFRYIHFEATEQEFARLQKLIEYLHAKDENSKVRVGAGMSDTFEQTVFRAMQMQLYTYLKNYAPMLILKKMHQKRLTAYEHYVKKQAAAHSTVSVGAPVFKKPTLYGTRHQAIANAKAQGYTALQIAALFGHVSLKTASVHYAPKRVGLKGSTKLAPNPENLTYILLALEDTAVQEAQKQHNQVHEVDFDEVAAYESDSPKQQAYEPASNKASTPKEQSNTLRGDDNDYTP